MYSSAIDDERAPLVIRTSKQRGLVDGMTVPEPLEHSVVGVPIEMGNSSVDRVAVPNPIEHSV